jgi:hypothetical protein
MHGLGAAQPRASGCQGYDRDDTPFVDDDDALLGLRDLGRMCVLR